MANEAFLVITPPASEPVDYQVDVKPYLRVDFADDDALIIDLVHRARMRAETITGRAFATQQIQQIFTIARPEGGEVSGPLDHGPNWYQYQEQLGANPFGAAQFYFDVAMPPIQTGQTVTVETKVTAFDAWTTFVSGLPSSFSSTVYIDNVQEPARLYFMSPVTANFWRFTYWAGYDASKSYALPYDLKQPLLELIALWYDNRQGEAPASQVADIERKFLAKRIANSWI